MAYTMDPRLGNRRQKQLLQQVASKMIQRSRTTNALGRFGRLGNTRGRVRSLTSAGALRQRAGSPKPLSGIDTLQVRGGAPNARYFIPTSSGGRGPSPLPVPDPNPGLTNTETMSGSLRALPPEQVDQSRLGDPEYQRFTAGLTDVDPFGVGPSTPPPISYDAMLSALNTLQGGGPQVQSLPNGLISLGNGVFLNPQDGTFFGTGGRL